MKYQDYFEKKVPQLVSNLNKDSQPSFGLMTAQHMIEHLIWITKASVKEVSPVPEKLTKSQEGFIKFIEKGAEFRYRPSDKTKDDLPALRFEDLERAKAELPIAITRMKNALSSKGNSETFYNPMMGSLTPDQMELFHKKHYEWHLEKQFGLGS